MQYFFNKSKRDAMINNMVYDNIYKHQVKKKRMCKIAQGGY